jgi:hypothetical protein
MITFRSPRPVAELIEISERDRALELGGYEE